MPIYEYQCNNCNSKIERLQKMADLPLVDCPKCAEPQLRRLVSASGFILKGTGWYETDFKTKGQSTLGKDNAVVPAASNEAVNSAGGAASNTNSADNTNCAGSAGGASSGSTTAAEQKPSEPSKAAVDAKAVTTK